MTPQARGTAVAIFSSAIYFGQTGGVAAGAFIFDRFGAVPLFAVTAIVLPALALWFAHQLKPPGTSRRTNHNQRYQFRPRETRSISARTRRSTSARQIVVEPGLEQRPQHLAHQIFKGASILHQHRLRKRIERGVDRRAGRVRDQRTFLGNRLMVQLRHFRASDSVPARAFPRSWPRRGQATSAPEFSESAILPSIDSGSSSRA